MVVEIHARTGTDDQPPPTPVPEPEPAPVRALAAVDEPPILRLATKTDRPREKRLAAFYIDDRLYTIASAVPANAALRYLHIQRTQGLESAIDFLLRTLLGPEGHEALMSYEDLEPEHLQQIIEKATRIMLGSLDGPKGPPSRG